MKQTPAMAYTQHKISSISKSELVEYLAEAPLTAEERHLVFSISEGMRYKELAKEFCLSESRISKWKRDVFTRLHRYDMRNIMR